ncbi:MAG TPA: hypothetical protein VM101_12855 [Flavitalea sp.]|nr:hypothetical protein [Flavitalea sp.]
MKTAPYIFCLHVSLLSFNAVTDPVKVGKGKMPSAAAENGKRCSWIENENEKWERSEMITDNGVGGIQLENYT